MKIISIGEIIFDVYGDEAEIGGAPLNFCAHCAACGAESALVSAVGNDDYASKALGYLNEFGVDTRFVTSNALSTGKCLVTINNGKPSYNVLRPVAYDAIDVEPLIDEIKSYGADVFAFGTLIQREEASRNSLLKILDECDFTHIFCDINLRKDCYDKQSCLNCFDNADIIKLSDEEEPLLFDYGFYAYDECEKVRIRNICAAFPNINIVIYTKGENGSLVYSKADDTFYEFPSIKTQVVSTVGAGDSYSAAFLCEFLKSGEIDKAGKAGAELSAFVVAHREAVVKK